jgi:hypothetical protein
MKTMVAAFGMPKSVGERFIAEAVQDALRYQAMDPTSKALWNIQQAQAFKRIFGADAEKFLAAANRFCRHCRGLGTAG